MKEVTEIYKKSIGRRISVGIPHYETPGRLFYIAGQLLSVNDEYIILDTGKSIRKIELKDVIEFQV